MYPSFLFESAFPTEVKLMDLDFGSGNILIFQPEFFLNRISQFKYNNTSEFEVILINLLCLVAFSTEADKIMVKMTQQFSEAHFKVVMGIITSK